MYSNNDNGITNCPSHNDGINFLFFSLELSVRFNTIQGADDKLGQTLWTHLKQ